MFAKYTTKIIKRKPFEAVKWTGDNYGQIRAFVSKYSNALKVSKRGEFIYILDNGMVIMHLVLGWFIYNDEYKLSLATLTPDDFNEIFINIKENV